jgi:putative membrane protein
MFRAPPSRAAIRPNEAARSGPVISFGVAAILVGGALLTALVGWFGIHAIGFEVLAAGWALAVIVPLHAAQLLLSAFAWRVAMGEHRPSGGRIFRIRWIRESVNSLLPVAQLGGNIVGIRLLMHAGISGAIASAGTTLDLTVESLTQFLFILIGLFVLAMLDADTAWAPWLDGTLGVTAVGLGCFVVAQRIGIMRIVESLARRLQRIFPSLSLHDELMRLQRDRAALLRATMLHLCAWGLGVGETLLVLRAMGLPVGVAESTVIESLGMAARSAGFAVPGALGVQETGFILACGLFGIAPDEAIALSMVKRARELIVGLPGLVAWQWTEGRRLLRRRPMA